MITPRITSMRFSCSPARKVPKAGDMRWLKGKKVWQIRQQEKHGRCHIVSNGRPVWEWVDRGSDRDREWRYSAAHSTENDTEGRRYFEDGCLCLIGGQMQIIASESNEKAVARYMAECKCSRHPEHEVAIVATPVLFYVNAKTRMCQALSGPPDGKDHLANIAQAAKDGFVQVTGDELDAFREVTAQAKAAGWNPDRMRYDTWFKKQVKP